jgi:thymidine kinase
MTRIISPKKSELHKLRQPLEEGELRVFEFFDRYLPKEWEIYIQPHLNGLRPDFVLLNPNVGIAVFEVKNWNLEAMKRWSEPNANGTPILFGSKDGKIFNLEKDNPITKIDQYRKEIKNLYCPRVNQRNASAIITAGVIFPSADEDNAQRLLRPFRESKNMIEWEKYNPVSGRNALKDGKLNCVFPEAKRIRSSFMNPELAADLRLWLVEPDASKVQRTPLELDKIQKNLANTRTPSGYRRITGSAGSGKSVVLAARAANLISQNKNILIVTFNITLINYLADTTVRNCSYARKNATWVNFHQLCARIAIHSGFEPEYKQIWKDYNAENSIDNYKDIIDFPNDDICNLVEQIINKNQCDEFLGYYDAILVDEGQDFHPRWWNILRKLCKKDGEMLLVADLTQDIYGTSSKWTDQAMNNAGFSGNWVKLGVSYRLPRIAISYIRDFGQRFLPAKALDLPTDRNHELSLSPCRLRWVQINNIEPMPLILEELNNTLKTQKEINVSDIVILVEKQKTGKDIVKSLNHKNIKTIDTFAEEHQKERNKKLAFFMGSACVKITTLHSFKGWETRSLIIYIEKSKDQKSKALLYTGLTRLKEHALGSSLTVICSDPQFIDYATTWPDYQMIDCSDDNFYDFDEPHINNDDYESLADICGYDSDSGMSEEDWIDSQLKDW